MTAEQQALIAELQAVFQALDVRGDKPAVNTASLMDASGCLQLAPVANLQHDAEEFHGKLLDALEVVMTAVNPEAGGCTPLRQLLYGKLEQSKQCQRCERK